MLIRSHGVSRKGMVGRRHSTGKGSVAEEKEAFWSLEEDLVG